MENVTSWRISIRRPSFRSSEVFEISDWVWPLAAVKRDQYLFDIKLKTKKKQFRSLDNLKTLSHIETTFVHILNIRSDYFNLILQNRKISRVVQSRILAFVDCVMNSRRKTSTMILAPLEARDRIQAACKRFCRFYVWADLIVLSTPFSTKKRKNLIHWKAWFFYSILSK